MMYKYSLLLLCVLILSSCAHNKQLYEILNEDLPTLSNRAKWVYENQDVSAGLYLMSGKMYLVSFSIVASCQEDFLQKRLSNERALHRASSSIFEPIHWAYDIDADFNPTAPQVELNAPDSTFLNTNEDEEWIQLPSHPIRNSYEFGPYNYDSTEKLIVHEHIDKDGLQPLMKFSGEKGETVYAYYYVLPPKDSLMEEKKMLEKEFQDTWDELDERHVRRNTE